VASVDSLNGYIAEVLVFNTGISPAQQHQVEAYLSQRYNLGFQPQSPSPTLSLPTGIYSTSQTETITPGQSGDTIYYTTNGTTPTTSSNIYTGPLTISSTTPLNVMEAGTGYSNSPVVTATCTIDPLTSFTRTGLVAWYRADTGITQSSGSVSQWTDQSGSGNNLTQSTGTLQPTLDTGVLNGQPVVHFTHADNSYLSVADNPSLDPSQITILTVARATGTSSGELVYKATGASGYALESLSGTSVALYLNGLDNVSGSLSENTWGVIAGEYNQTDISLYINDVLTQGAYTTAIASSSQPLTVGGFATAGFTPDCDIAEVLIFNTTLSDEERLNIESYFAQRYGVPQPGLPSPVFSVSGGTLSAPQEIAITAPPGATIYYTLNGTTPTTSSLVYTGPIYVPYTETIEAVVYENGYVASPVMSETYTLNSTEYPAPETGDPTPPTISLQLPTDATLLP
jgi:hypothetical protein